MLPYERPRSFRSLKSSGRREVNMSFADKSLREIGRGITGSKLFWAGAALVALKLTVFERLKYHRKELRRLDDIVSEHSQRLNGIDKHIDKLSKS